MKVAPGLAACFMILTITAQADMFIPGDDLYRAQEFKRARQAYLGAARDATDTSLSAAAQYRAAACLYDLGDYDAFQQEAQTLLGRHPGVHIEKTLFLKHRLAQLPFIRGDWAAAAGSLGAFAREYPRCEYTFDALNNQARALIKLNRPAEARRIYLDYRSANKKSVFVEKASLKAALCLHEMGDFAAFEKEGREALARYPANRGIDAEWIRLHLAQMPGKRGQWEETARELEALIAGHPENTREHAMIDCGGAWLAAAGQADRRGQKDKAAELTIKGRGWLTRARSELADQLATGKRSRSNEDVRMMILESHFVAKDFAGLAQAADVLTTEFHPPSRLWARGMIYKGMACLERTPRDLDGAAAAFDAVIGTEVKDSAAREHIPTLALCWRIAAAREQKDAAALERCRARLAAMPDGPYKTSALAEIKKTK